LAGRESRTAPPGRHFACGWKVARCSFSSAAARICAVQAKMAGSPRILQAFYRLYFGFWIPTLVWASTWWPLGLMYWMARRLVMLPFNLVRPKYLRAVKSNYSRILGLPADHPEVRRVTWQMGYEHAYHWIDLFRWSQLPSDRFFANVAAVEGQEHFERARAAGRGTLLLTAHLGNPEVGAVGLARSIGKVYVLYWRNRFDKAEEFRTRMRARNNVIGIPVDASPFSVVPALRVLRDKGVLAAHADRDFNDQGWALDFFGAPAKFPPGPFLLAERVNALLVPVFILLEPDRRFRVVYREPIDVTGAGPAEERVRAAMRRWLVVLEEQIRQRPEQWYCFYPFWGQPIT
jgi:lauroyl/myristoyl acyltransferase